MKVLKKIIYKDSKWNKIGEKESNIQIISFCENEKAHYIVFGFVFWFLGVFFVDF